MLVRIARMSLQWSHILPMTDKGKITREIIRDAKEIAISSGVRAAMYLTGNGGSGIVSARLPNGSWSPPSAFSVRTGGVGLAYGVDVYDCIWVLNTQLKALQQLPRFLQISPTSLQRETWRSGPFDGSVALRTLRENMSEPWAFGNSGSLIQHLLYWLSLYPTS